MKAILNKKRKAVTGKEIRKYLIRILTLYLLSVTFKSFDTSFSHELLNVSERGQWFSLIFVLYGLLVWELGIVIKNFTERHFEGRNLQVKLLFLGLALVFYGGLVSIVFGIIYAQFDIFFFDLGLAWQEVGYFDYNLNVGLFVFYLLILTFTGLNYYHNSWHASAIQAERLKKENIQAKFDALRHQIEPHFFFNSLSVLTNLVYKDADLSAQYITQLAKMYRYLLDKKFQNLVPLPSELEFIKAYIFLINIRHQQNVIVSISLSEDICRRGYLPPATLQILLENAVKHNCFTKESPLNIQVNEVENGICVINNRVERELLHASTGLGLENIKNRYALLCGKTISIKKSKNSFEVFVPIIYSET